MLTELNRDTYLRYLEADYSKRMVEQHKDELGIFGRVDPTFTLKPGETPPDRLEDYLNNQMEGILKDDSVMKQIDAEINDITSAETNTKAKSKNLKNKVDD